ncbi:proteasome regulatory particle base subunit [Boothiomyces sp. JEL0838]|nr:proteasome regulatory particle base subunit [Boothiomyces sp. JEL0838]
MIGVLISKAELKMPMFLQIGIQLSDDFSYVLRKWGIELAGSPLRNGLLNEEEPIIAPIGVSLPPRLLVNPFKRNPFLVTAKSTKKPWWHVKNIDSSPPGDTLAAVKYVFKLWSILLYIPYSYISFPKKPLPKRDEDDEVDEDYIPEDFDESDESDSDQSIDQSNEIYKEIFDLALEQHNAKTPLEAYSSLFQNLDQPITTRSRKTGFQEIKPRNERPPDKENTSYCVIYSVFANLEMTTTEEKKEKSKPVNKKEEKKEEELSEEDLVLKSELEMLVERLKENKPELHRPALETLRTLIRTSTSSMTSVPKPLKFLRPHYGDLQAVFESWKPSDTKKFLADTLSVLAMSYADEGTRDSLKYRLLGTQEDAGSWGHEYVRHLSAEIIAEYQILSESENQDQLKVILDQGMKLVPFFMSHNAEADACDLLIELESLDKLPGFVDKVSFPRVCLYIVGCAPYVTPPDDIVILKTAHEIYKKFDQHPSALQIALKLNDLELIKQDFNTCPDPLVKKQLAYMLARQQVLVETEDEELSSILDNSTLSEHFMALARDLDVVEPKLPEDIYKTHLENTRPGLAATVDSAKQNLASTFVNAFLNCGFGADKLMMGSEDSNWIFKNKDHGMMSATASLGAILLWDVENGLTQIDKYLYSNEDYVKAGALLAIGLVSSGVRNESDPALALLSEHVNGDKEILRIAAIVGLGIAYAGRAREEVQELLLPLISDTGITMELSSLAALSLGLVYASSCHGEITSTILQTYMERDDINLKDPYARMMGVGLALLFLGKQEAAEAPIETLKAIENPLAKQTEVMVEICAYAGTGNVLKVQKMLHHCNDHLDPEKEDPLFQAFAVIGIAMIAMGEDIGQEMAFRQFNHLMHYGEPVIRKAVPLAIGLLCASNPLVNILDLLSKYSHDHDQDVSINAIFAMGLVGAGTNNARLAQMLRQLAAYYHKEPNHLFMVRIAQGLLHMGKGTLTANPFTSGRMLMSIPATASLFILLTSFTNSKTFVFGKAHYFLYYLIPSIYPRFLMTLDENGKVLPATVRVGQAVDVVGQAGRPKTITGFQTHTTPVLLAYTERAELGTEEFVSVSPYLEGFVILKKNPEYEADVEMK